MASKSDAKEAKELFDQDMEEDMKAFKANRVIADWYQEAVNKGLDGIVCDQVADETIADPGEPAEGLNRDQQELHKMKVKLYKDQKKDLAELASFYKRSLTAETYDVLVAGLGHASNAYLDARDLYKGFSDVHLKVCKEDLYKVLRKMRTLFIPGKGSITAHTMAFIKCLDQVNLARDKISTAEHIDDLVETLQDINRPQMCDLTIEELKKESAAEALADVTKNPFVIFTKNIMSYDRHKRFGDFSVSLAEANRNVSRSKVETPIAKLDMVKESVPESDMTRILKLLEAVVVGKTGGGAYNRNKPYSKESVKAAREKYKDVDLKDDCPIHPGNPPKFPCTHAWGKCSSYTGDPFKKERRN